MRTSETHSSAHVAPREAARALSVRRDGTTHTDLTETSYRTLAADLAVTLDAVASLLRSVGVGVGPNASTYGLLSAAEHLDMGALMPVDPASTTTASRRRSRTSAPNAPRPPTT